MIYWVHGAPYQVSYKFLELGGGGGGGREVYIRVGVSLAQPPLGCVGACPPPRKLIDALRCNLVVLTATEYSNKSNFVLFVIWL